MSKTAIILLATSTIFSCEECAKQFDPLIEETLAQAAIVLQSGGNCCLDIQTYYYIQGVWQGLREGKELCSKIEHPD